MDPVICVFCTKEIPFSSLSVEKAVLITVEREEDGAGVWYEYYAHEACLPKELK